MSHFSSQRCIVKSEEEVRAATQALGIKSFGEKALQNDHVVQAVSFGFSTGIKEVGFVPDAEGGFSLIIDNDCSSAEELKVVTQVLQRVVHNRALSLAQSTGAQVSVSVKVNG